MNLNLKIALAALTLIGVGSTSSMAQAPNVGETSEFKMEQLAVATRTDKMMKMTYKVVKMADGKMMAMVPMSEYEELLKKSMGQSKNIGN